MHAAHIALPCRAWEWSEIKTSEPDMELVGTAGLGPPRAVSWPGITAASLAAAKSQMWAHNLLEEGKRREESQKG